MPVMESFELKVLSMFIWQSHGRGFMIEDGDCFVPRNDVSEEEPAWPADREKHCFIFFSRKNP